MADKSIRSNQTKKAGKSIKEKRAEKNAAAASKSSHSVVPPAH